MRIGISNIAWDVDKDEQVLEILKAHRIDAIDIAPGKYFVDITKVTLPEIDRVRNWWQMRGIEITGMQSLLFGTFGLNLFGSSEIQEQMLNRLESVCRIAGRLESPRLVFGSPKNRDRSGLDDEHTRVMALDFFKRLADIAEKNKVIICLEPNPKEYACNFMTTSFETAAVVRATDHDFIRMQLDTGALTMNHENPKEVLKNCSDLIGHIHASEPKLVPLGLGTTNHAAMASEILNYLPNHLVTIEMLIEKGQNHLDTLNQSIGSAVSSYRGET